jgi:hypothetical protein
MRCKVLSLDEVFQGTYFGHVFLRLVNMLQLVERFAKTLNLFQSSLPSQIYRNVELGFKSLGNANMNGTMHV